VYVTDDIFGITEGEIGCGGDEKNCINVTPWDTESLFKIAKQILNNLATIWALIWVLVIVYGWIARAMWDNLKGEAKKKIMSALIWLAILFLAGSALIIIAPWAYE
jgi:hypothetical protein